MSSPVNIAFRSFIKFDRTNEDPVYMQIVYQFINAVRRKLLEDGDRLPGSRKIAEDLQVHRKTIISALLELQEQGWITSTPNIGTFVKNPELTLPGSTNKKAFQHPPEKSAFSFRKEFILDNPFPERSENLFFTDGTPDYTTIKVEELVRFYSGVLRRTKKSNEWQTVTDGNLHFRDQLSYYLNVTRGFHVSREFLLPISSREQVFSILSRLLINTGDIVLIEELSYFLPNMIFNQAGAHLKTVPVDEDGMQVHFIQEHYKPGEIRFVYINSRCQYPTGAQLSEERKIKLLQLAEQYGFFIIEDDVDYEFSNLKNSTSSLFTKDGGQRVIYIGAFGRFLAPGFQMNFLIAPKDLLEEGKKYLNIFGKPNAMMEKALGDMIYQGDIHRYQRKSQRTVNERKKIFAELLELHFNGELNFKAPLSGLAFWLQFNNNVSLTRLREKARAKGLLVPGICLYQNRKIAALRLGFAHLNPQDMEEAIKLLAKAYQEVV